MIINMNGAKAPETPSPVLQEKTVTPETLPTVIGADEGYDGLSQVTVNPDSQLIPTNIRLGKTVFGVTGTFAGNGNMSDSQAKIFEFWNLGKTVLDEISSKDFREGYGRVLQPGELMYGSAKKIHIYASDWANGLASPALVKCGEPANNFGNDLRFIGSTIYIHESLSGNYNAMLKDGVCENLVIEPRSVLFPLTSHLYLTSCRLDVPEGVTELKSNCFIGLRGYKPYRYTDLTLTLPSTLTKLNTMSIDMVGSVIIKAITPPEMPPSYSNNGITGTIKTITVPIGTLESYRTANGWKAFADIMVEATE